MQRMQRKKKLQRMQERKRMQMRTRIQRIEQMLIFQNFKEYRELNG